MNRVERLERRSLLAADPISQFFIADTDTDEVVTEVFQGSTIDSDLVSGRRVTLFAVEGVTADAERIESASLRLNDGRTRIENVTPYALGGDRNGDFIRGIQLEDGTHQLAVSFYDQNRARGNLLEEVDLVFQVLETDLPSFRDLHSVVSEDGSLTVFADSFLVESSERSYSIEAVSEPQDGTLQLSGEEYVLEYTPDDDFFGAEQLFVTLYDQENPNDTVTVRWVIEVLPVNDAPIAEDDSVSLEFGESVIIDVLANDIDVDGDPLEVQASPSFEGTVDDLGSGTFRFTPTKFGPGEFSYAVTDPSGAMDFATVFIEIAPPGGILPVRDLTIRVPSNSSEEFLPANAFLSIPTAGTVYFLSEPEAQNGSIQLMGEGSLLTYTPDSGFVGVENISVTIWDQMSLDSAVTVTLTIEVVPS
ncbi:MAG: tandem-95 repeat protein [Planctomycetota bacterium]